MLVACSSEPVETNSSQITNIQFSTANAFEIDDFVADQSYVLLSNAEEALFSRVDKLIAKNDQFYLFDYLAERGVLVFDAKGNFIRRVGEFGEGPQQLGSITDIQVTDKGDIQILDQRNKVIQVYSNDGDWKEEIPIPVHAGGFIKKNEKWILAMDFENQSKGEIGQSEIGVFNEDMSLDTLYFEYSAGSENANMYYHAGLLAIGKDFLSYHRPPNDTISIFSNSNILQQRIVIDFEKNQLPKVVVENFELIEPYEEQGVDFRYLQTPALPVGNMLFGLIMSTAKEFWTFALDTKSMEIYTKKVDLSDLHIKDLIIPTAKMGEYAVITMIDPMTFTQEENPKKYPAEVTAHLKSEGTVLLIHHLKKR